MPDGKKLFVSILPLALLGAMLATFCDAIHAHTGTLVYPDPWLFQQAFWVFPLFFLTFITMAVSYDLIVRWLPAAIAHDQSMGPGTLAACVETLTSFGLVYLLSGFGSREPGLLSAIFYGAFVLRLAVTYEKGFLLLLALIMAVTGMIAEGSLAVFELVHYRQPEIFNVPFWLGALYMHGAFALRESMRFFVWGNGRS
ncbi:MAG: hypothetical protein AB1724_17810 [Thermodesulfobacteriota bacterium]